jgi:hypothetical protein
MDEIVKRQLGEMMFSLLVLQEKLRVSEEENIVLKTMVEKLNGSKPEAGATNIATDAGVIPSHQNAAGYRNGDKRFDADA